MSFLPTLPRAALANARASSALPWDATLERAAIVSRDGTLLWTATRGAMSPSDFAVYVAAQARSHRLDGPIEMVQTLRVIRDGVPDDRTIVSHYG